MGVEERTGFNKVISYNDLFKFLSAIVIPLMVWGINVEKRINRNDLRVEELNNEVLTVEKNSKEMEAKINQILISVNEIKVILRGGKL